MLLNKDTGKTRSIQHMHGASCSCPACLGLQCLERPRYFSGQLLTEMDLNSEQEYMLAKQRLHNRYLHGWGIVCGLEVSCSTCAGAVTIQSGYAIDPCGNDIIVCDTQDFNVIQRIHDCEKARKRQQKSNCNPIPPPADTNCQDIERHYCLTIAYSEQEKRLSPILRQGGTSSPSNGKSCTCGNGNGKKGGCGCTISSSSGGSQYTSGMTQTSGYSVMSASSASSVSSQSNSAISCQPTRVLEGYQLDICEVPPEYCDNLKDILEDTLLAKIIECFTSLKGFLDRKLPGNVYTILTPLAFTGTIDTSVSMEELYRSCCYLRQTIHDLYGCDPLGTHCQTLNVLSQVCCQAPPAGDVTQEMRAAYVEQARATLYDLLALLMQYMLDCICQALLPCCPIAPEDDRLILACMTVRDDQIVDICNFCHRHYAGSFPALYYWLSLVPVIPLIAYAVEQICCYDWLKGDFPGRQNNPQGTVFRGNLVNGLASLLNRMDPAGSLRKELFADNFAMPRNYVEKFTQLFNKVSSPMKVADMVPPEAFNLTTIMHKPIAEATTTLQAASITPFVHTVASIDEVPIIHHLTTSPFAMAGEHIILYSANDQVVGYAALTSLPDIEQVKHDVSSLRENLAQVPQAADVNQIKSDVETLQGNVANTAQAADLDPLKNDIESLKSAVANTAQSTALDEVKSDVETLKGNIANAAPSSALDSIRTDVETLRGNVASAAQTGDLEAVKNDVETLKGNVTNAAQAADVEQLRSDLAQFAQAADVSQLRSDVEALTGNVANAAQSSTLDTVSKDVEALKESLANAAQATDVEQLRNNLAQFAQGSDVEQLKSDMANVVQPSALEPITNDIQALKDNMSNAAQAADVNGLRDEVSGLKDEVATLSDTLAKFEQPAEPPQEISDLQTTIKALQDELAALRNEIDQLKARDTSNAANASDAGKTEGASNTANVENADNAVDKEDAGDTGDTGENPPAEPAQ